MSDNSKMQGIDIDDFVNRKKNGFANATKIGTTHFSIYDRQFDVRTGEEVAPKISTVNLDALRQARSRMVTQHEQRLAGLDAMIAELEAIE